MFECLCGKSFDQEIACTRHKSSCGIYREYKRSHKEIRNFLNEGIDHVVCKICKYKAKDLSRHLYESREPHLSLKAYREMFPDHKLVCSEVEEKRKQTCLKIHGDPNYRNIIAQRQGVKDAFAADPSILERIRETKLKRYGDAGYVNIEKRKRTLLQKYGVDNPMKVSEIKDRSIHIHKMLYENNPILREPVISKETLIDMHYTKNMNLCQMASHLGFSPEKVSYWMHKFNLEVNSIHMIPKIKEYVDPMVSIKEYLDFCLNNNKICSFSEFGKGIKSEKKVQRLKRLFNTGKPYHHLLGELKRIALQPEKFPEFLEKFKDS